MDDAKNGGPRHVDNTERQATTNAYSTEEIGVYREPEKLVSHVTILLTRKTHGGVVPRTRKIKKA